MKKYYTLLLLFTALIFLISGCSKSGKTTEITGLSEYKDAVTEMTIKYPANWYVAQKSHGNRFLVFTSQNDMERFRNYSPEGASGAKIEVVMMKIDSTVTLDSIIKVSMKFTKDTYSNPENVTLGGMPATKHTYAFMLEDGKFQGEFYVAMKDGKMATILYFEAFTETMSAYRKSFDDIVASIKIANPEKDFSKVEYRTEEQPPPSPNLTQKDGTGYSISIPDNFKAERTKVAGTIYSANYIGLRRGDCNIQVDVLTAPKKKGLKEIVDDNLPNYKGGDAKETTLSGAKAYVIGYSFRKDASSRVYFALKADKLFRITMNWFKGEEADYLPVFEKCIQTFKLL
ncbi:MAG: hypothetical protein HW421_2889 [Ignavibacteria bacterium]|nr:hypothetical protein [Ignavibacteria bacterium]